MIKKSLLALLLLVLAAAVVVSCAKNGPLAPAAQPRHGSIMINMDVLDNVNSGTVEITQGPLSFTSPITMAANMHGTGAASFNDLQTGTWTVTAKLYDAASTLRYYATGTAVVNLYQTTSVTLSITAGGKLAINNSISGNEFLFTSNTQLIYKWDGTKTTIPGISGSCYGACNPRSGGEYYYTIVNYASINCFKKDGSWNQVLIDNSHGEYFGNYSTVRPSWDGTKIAFYHNGTNTNTACCIGIGNVSGGTLTGYQYIPKIGVSDENPIWTADGRIVFTLNNGTTYQLYIMNSDGSNITLIPNTSGVNPVPEDCSANNQLLYSTSVNGTRNIYRINLDGTNNAGLTSSTSPTWSSYPRFRNDDGMIVYQSCTSGVYSIYQMLNDSTGSSKTLISTGDNQNQFPCYIY